MNNILHLTHTDIKSDSRILKELNSIAKSNSALDIYGLGVNSDEDRNKSSAIHENITLYSIVLRSRKLTCLPRVIRHVFTLMELMFKMVVKAVKLQPNVIHCHDIVVLPLGVIVKLFSGAKLIYDAHELESDRNDLSKILGKVTLFTEKLLWRFIDVLIVVSPSINKWYKENISDKKSEVILNSPVLEKSISLGSKTYFRDKFSIPDDTKIFLYIGILGRGRGLDLITEVFQKKERASHVVFLGAGELSSSLKDLSTKHDNIHLHDAVPHEQVVSIAQSADVGLCLIQNVSLSDYYCLPNKLFEYCFSGIPVLASAFPDITNTVNTYKLGICCDLTIEAIEKSIRLYEEDLVDVNIDMNRLQDLSWQRQEEKLNKLYKDVLNQT